MGNNFSKEAYDGARAMIKNPDHKWMRYVNRLLDETDPHVAKMTALNLGFQAAFLGTKTIRKMREVHNCNIPWLILMDPTSACNLHCTGCWAAEYGNKLNLTFDEMDSIVTQGKELGIYFYMMTGGEPLVRKADIIRLCEKHNECAFHCYTNGTLVDQAFCDEMKRVGNLSLSISLEGFEDANDFRRGAGVYDKVIHAMDLLHENGLIFGNSVCYTRKNMDAVTSDEFFDLLIEHGSRFAWYFHLMPVGMKAAWNRCLRQNSVNIFTTESVRSVQKKAEKKFSLWTSRMMVSLSADVSQAAETTATSIQREMLSLAYLSTTPVPISVRNHCLNV